MRHAVLLLLLALVAGCSATPSPTTAADGRLVVPRQRPVALLVAGDSLAGGYFATTRGGAFPVLVSAGLGGAQESRPPLRDQPLTTVDRVLDMPAGQDVVVVELGTNDVGRRTPAVDFRARYAALLDRARAGSPTAALVCLGVWAGDGGRSGGADYDTIIGSLCAEHAGRFVGLTALYSTPANRGPAGVPTPVGPSDAFHPNDRGHRAIADAVLAVLDTQEDPCLQ